MLSDFSTLEAFDENGLVRIIVETPKGSNVKISYDPRLKVFRGSRKLTLGLSYPNYRGFIPDSLGQDGDAVDALVCHESSTYPGVLQLCRPIGQVRLEQTVSETVERIANDRVVAVPHGQTEGVTNLSEMPTQQRAQIEQFFCTATYFTDKHVRITGWGDASYATAYIRQHILLASG